ncbi:MAG TPA: hypothetical protein VK364_04170, partial [Hymenobacter sp.]|nr:hypothetical protein [Hymenobacter sp.]
MATTLPLLAPNVTMTAAEFVTVNFRLWLRQPATRRNHWILGTALVLLAVSVGLDIIRTGHISSWNTLAFLGVGVLYGLLRTSLVRYQLRRGYSRNAALRDPISFVFDANMLRGHGATGRFEIPWSKVRRAVWVRPNWLLLYPNETGCFYVDLRQLQAPTTPDGLLALVRNQ